MLDVIADFWKPVKKTQPQEKLQPDQLQIGSTIGFGFVPQANLSGRRLDVSAINTYQFGDETLTSFVLSQEKDPGMSMIVAESDGEHYLAISRRISLNDRTRLFDGHDLENIMTKPDITKLPCKDNIAEYKNWVVASYKREINGLKGRIYRGDFRRQPAPPAGEGLQFDYTLLVSDSNEHAIEIEKYHDGRVEVYATIYRRMNDVGEITHPNAERARPDIKLASGPETAPTPAAPVVSSADSKPAAEQPAKPAEAPKTAEPPKAAETAKPAPIKLQEFTQAPAVAAAKPEPARPAAIPYPTTATQEKKPAMTTQETAINGAKNAMNTTSENKQKLYVQPTAPESYMKQEVKTVNNGAMTNFDADAIECDLRVANKIIDEAIRNEMRLTDIVRRIIELPVAYQESVQIPVTLTDEDYALLAIRYGISASDRGAIKRRIIEDLNDFSGATAKKLAA